jgi:hypothetical protein
VDGIDPMVALQADRMSKQMEINQRETGKYQCVPVTITKEKIE